MERKFQRKSETRKDLHGEKKEVWGHYCRVWLKQFRLVCLIVMKFNFSLILYLNS